MSRQATRARCLAAAVADLHRAAWGPGNALPLPPFNPVADQRAAILSRLNKEA